MGVVFEDFELLLKVVEAFFCHVFNTKKITKKTSKLYMKQIFCGKK